MTNEETSNDRISFLVGQYWSTQTIAAQALGISQPYINQVMNSKREVSGELLQKIAKVLPEVNIDWVVTGQGEWLKPVNTYQKGGALPDMQAVDTFVSAVANHYQPSLGVKQELTLRQACYRVLVDHPGAPMSALLIAAGVYLRFIEAYPNLSLPPEAGAAAVVDPLPPVQ